MTCVRRELGGTQVTRREGGLTEQASQPDPDRGPRRKHRPETACAWGRGLGLGGAAAERGKNLNHFEIGIRVRRKVSARRTRSTRQARLRFRLAPAVSCRPAAQALADNSDNLDGLLSVS